MIFSEAASSALFSVRQIVAYSGIGKLSFIVSIVDFQIFILKYYRLFGYKIKCGVNSLLYSKLEAVIPPLYYYEYMRILYKVCGNLKISFFECKNF